MLASNKLYRVNKGDLLAKLQENRTKHAQTYKDAVVKYRERATVALAKQLAHAKEGKRFSLSFTLPKPVNYLKQYDQVIGLLEMTTDQTIEITPNDYSCYVLDEWDWKGTFSFNTVSYTGSTGAQGPTGATGPSGGHSMSSSDDDDVNYSDDDDDDED